jgi:hypothetical protein
MGISSEFGLKAKKKAISFSAEKVHYGKEVSSRTVYRTDAPYSCG